MKFIKKSLNGKELIIFGDGTQINDFIYVEDLVNLISIIIEKGIQGIYNVGYGKGLPIIEIAEKIVKIVGKNNKIIKKPLSEEEDMFELGGSIMNISKIKEVSGWEPKVSLEEGLEKIKNFYMNNK